MPGHHGGVGHQPEVQGRMVDLLQKALVFLRQFPEQAFRAGMVPPEKGFVAVHADLRAREDLAQAAVHIEQFIRLRVDQIDPGALVFEDRADGLLGLYGALLGAVL